MKNQRRERRLLRRETQKVNNLNKQILKPIKPKLSQPSQPVKDYSFLHDEYRESKNIITIDEQIELADQFDSEVSKQEENVIVYLKDDSEKAKTFASYHMQDDLPTVTILDHNPYFKNEEITIGRLVKSLNFHDKTIENTTRSKAKLISDDNFSLINGHCYLAISKAYTHKIFARADQYFAQMASSLIPNHQL